MLKLAQPSWLRGLAIASLMTLTFFAQADSGEPKKEVDPDQFQIQEDEWELLSREDGIETYRMRHKGTEVQTFKGVAFVDAKIEVVGEVMRDIPNYPKWMHNFKKTEILKTIDRNTYVFHTVIKTPIIYQNRDLVVENTTTYNFDNGTARLDFWAAKDYQYPEQKGLFRINMLEGFYLLEYFGRDKTRVSYQFRSNPGGNIPLAVANWVEIRHFPYHTLKGWQRMVKEEKYIKSGLASPEHDLIEKMLDDRSKQEIILRNRLFEYIPDRYLIDTIFAMPETAKVVDHMYQQRATYDSIREAMVDLFTIIGDKMVGQIDQNPELKAKLTAMMAHIQPKPFDSFFNMDKFMQEGWLVAELTKNPKVVQNLLRENSELAHQLFEKITTSETAVKAFIRSKSLAYKILDNPKIREQLWQDQELRKQLGEQFSQIKTLKDFEKLVRSRVDTYAS